MPPPPGITRQQDEDDKGILRKVYKWALLSPAPFSSVHDPLGATQLRNTTCGMAAAAVTFIVTSLLVASTVLSITLDAGSLESIRHMRPPPLPPHSRSSGFPTRSGPSRPPAPQFTVHPQTIQQPSVIISGGIRSVENNFGQLQQNFPPGQQNRPLPQLLESVNRRPQHFPDVQSLPQTFGFSAQDISNTHPPDSFLAAAQQNSFSLQSQQFNTPFHIQQAIFPQTIIGSSKRIPNQPPNGIVTISSQQLPPNQLSKPSAILSSSVSQQFNLNSQPQTQTQEIADNLISATGIVQHQPPQNLLIQNLNVPWGQTSAQPAEFFSDFNRTFTGRQFEQDALKITAPPVLGPAATDPNKKALLKDVLSEDCPRAKQDGFCASPPRYPSQQISQLIGRCSEVVKALYVPLPQDDGRNTSEIKYDVEEQLSLPHFNSTSEMQRGNRQLWSWAKAAVEQETACGAQRQWVEPGYVRDNSGRWYVVLQAGDSLTQRVHLETCQSPGKPCSAIKCSSFSNKLATSHCVQRYSYSLLIVWDPDQQDACPQLRVFRFPSACVCYLGP